MDTTETYDAEALAAVTAQEQALLDQSVQQAQVGHLQQRVVQLAMRVRELEAQLGERTDDEQEDGRA